MTKNKAKTFKIGSAVLVVMFASTSMISTVAFANTGLEGKYKYVSTQCSSGAPANMAPPAGIETSFKSELTFTSDQATLLIDLFFKYDGAAGAAQLQQIEDAIAYVQTLPDGPEKETNLKSLRDAEDLVKRMIAGLSCTMTTQSSYTVEGSTLHSGNNSVTTDCPGFEAGPVSPLFDATYQLSGNSLSFSDKPEENDVTCPKGDLIITNFERM